MRSALGEVKRVLKIFVFFVFLPLFLAPSCKPRDSNSSRGPALDLTAPTGFAATTFSNTRIDLAWTNVALDAIDLEIERSVDGGAFAPLVTLPASAATYSDTLLTASTRYGYRIRAVNAGSVGPWVTVFADTILVQSVTTTPDPTDGAPTARMGHSMIYDPGGDRLLILGGLTAPGVVTNELWALDLSTNAWSKPATTAAVPGLRPTARMGHTAIRDAANNRMVVFGGIDPSLGEYENVFFLDLTTMDWTQPAITQSPLARAGHSAIYDAANERMVIYGGTDSAGAFDDVWELTLPAGSGTIDWSDLTPSVTGSAGLRSGHSAVYDGPGGRMIVFGGQDTTPPPGPLLNDLYELSLTTLTWSPISATGAPLGRTGHSAVLNGSSMLVFGGSIPAASQEFWKLDLGSSTWTPVLGSTLPGARLGHSVVFPTGSTTMMIFGGGSAPDTPSFFDLWSFGM